MSSLSSRPCPICGSRTEERRFRAREMLLGTRDPFEYVECGDCASLYITSIPRDLARYYGGAYYSYTRPFRHALPKRLIKRAIGGLVLRLGRPAAWVVDRTVGVPAPLHWMRMAGAGFDTRILDVGSGSGQHLVSLAELGFRSLLGVDPYIPKSIETAPGVRVLKASLEEVEGSFDLIMFHHSLEHLSDPAAALVAARRRLDPGGCVLVRVPTVGASWRHYGADWVELDAPRHLQVPSRAGMHRLAERAGLRIRRAESDTTGFELWASEQYQRDIPLSDPRSHWDGQGDVFTPRELRDFERRAAALNRSGEAGRAAFWMNRVEEGQAEEGEEGDDVRTE